MPLMGTRTNVRDWGCFAVLVVVMAMNGRLWAQAKPTTKYDPKRWEPDIARFEQQDRTNPPPKNGILFTGSSTIRMWKLPDYFPDLPVYNRGFGGSRISDSVCYADRILLPNRPSAIVFFAGSNDIAGGVSPHQQVAEDWKQFVAKVRSALPETRILYIGITPSPKRWDHIEKQREANRLIRDFSATQKNVLFLATEPHMLSADGQPRPELFLADRLHLNADGYKLLSGLVRANLESAHPKPATN